jgi:hypothetical protein
MDDRGDRNDRDEKRRRTCGTTEEHERLLREEPGYAERVEAVERYTRQFERATAGEGLRTGVAIIPVVVHVVFRNAAQNITDAQIQSQITILNEDFRRLNADAASVPAAFAPVAADARIRFQLAVRDPNCNPTSGITRTSTTVTTFWSNTNNIKSTATGGRDPWPADRYLNIWVGGDIQDPVVGALLGYAQFPGGPAATDGVVMLHSAVGNTGTAAAPFDRGRTATHEIGHWLNLRHIFQGGCADQDLVADTPPQAASNFGCPTFPSVTCTNGPNGDMFMNYMDYVDDACMFMFTAGQATRMNAALTGPRASILASDGIVPPPVSPTVDLWSQDTPADLGVEPNPTSAPMWQSDDIWVRRQNDGLMVQDHENPEYRAPGGSPNHVYVRVRNLGCGGSGTGTVKLYWAKASTALGWPAPWDGSVTTPALMGGSIGSQPTGTVAGGASTVVSFPWSPPNPADYASFGADQAHFCLLSRIETSSTSPFGMTTPEGSNLYQNVQANNNIVWKNIQIVDEVPGTGRKSYVVVGNPDKRAAQMRLVFEEPDGERRSIFDWGSLYVDLGEKLFARWSDGGGDGDAIEVVDREVLLLKPGAWLAAKLDRGELQAIAVRFEPRTKESENAVYLLDLMQYRADADQPLGGIRFVLKTAYRRRWRPSRRRDPNLVG